VKIDRIFQIVAAILVCIAAYFFWMQNKDAVFVSLVLAACGFFLSIRFQAKARLEDEHAADEPSANDEIS